MVHCCIQDSILEMFTPRFAQRMYCVAQIKEKKIKFKLTRFVEAIRLRHVTVSVLNRWLGSRRERLPLMRTTELESLK
jgi:hypothetical protein